MPITAWDTAFNDLYRRIAPYFRRTETRERRRRYVFGLLSRAERKNSWQLAETMHEPNPQGIQRLLTTAQWDVDGVRDALRAYVIDHLSVPGGVLGWDETGRYGEAGIPDSVTFVTKTQLAQQMLARAHETKFLLNG